MTYFFWCCKISFEISNASPLSLRVMALTMDSRSRPSIRHLWKKAQYFPIYIKIQKLFPRVWQLFDYIYLNVCSVGRTNSYLLDIGLCNFAKINISEHFSYMGISNILYVCIKFLRHPFRDLGSWVVGRLHQNWNLGGHVYFP